MENPLTMLSYYFKNKCWFRVQKEGEKMIQLGVLLLHGN
jgi:hypothetical protein